MPQKMIFIIGTIVLVLFAIFLLQAKKCYEYKMPDGGTGEKCYFMWQREWRTIERRKEILGKGYGQISETDFFQDDYKPAVEAAAEKIKDNGGNLESYFIKILQERISEDGNISYDSPILILTIMNDINGDIKEMYFDAGQNKIIGERLLR